ncbi:hypothetical protein HNR40_009704 [Nonomuraea endophytica]|uniref:Uncharacterized protein n=1 Tax=Nonomuraea endophytica TaxID=714136 RepID=A0A7W8ADC7_9ACTN|nr:hypothetical protein [Nonomuraea endophytica]
MAFVLELQALNAPKALTAHPCYSHVTSYAGTC